MDPLHPLVPIQPAPPTPPDYTRIQRIQRDQGREAAPDWQQPDDDAQDEQRGEQFEDDYDPNWSDTAAAEAYDEHGLLTDGATSDDVSGIEPQWDRRRDGERRSSARASEYPDDDERPGPHIDIIA